MRKARSSIIRNPKLVLCYSNQLHLELINSTSQFFLQP
ncbi:Uncharacterized protein APZ42_000949 [Daphnia magna]|uniref:Uncharacterized protein n=1 Tax=Daphnia magna TaxID=35525 RepID=A0A164J9Y0_9CRUS|nr:Uncharacterized protein APZ42_000949 [Daphnia magna]